ncbi:unnamed protein product [Natator depressus]
MGDFQDAHRVHLRKRSAVVLREEVWSQLGCGISAHRFILSVISGLCFNASCGWTDGALHARLWCVVLTELGAACAPGASMVPVPEELRLKQGFWLPCFPIAPGNWAPGVIHSPVSLQCLC